MKGTLPTLTPGRLRAAVTHLRRSDPRLRAAMDRAGPCRFERRVEGTHFDALLRAIVYQQLSGKAAATIYGRVLDVFGGAVPDEHAVLSADPVALASAGLSRQKLSYILDLARHVADGALPLHRVERMVDEDVIEALTAVKGIGRWSAQMFLMFRMGRPDVFPELDLGVRKGIQLIDGLDETPSPGDLVERVAPWAPWRTVASWYLWRAVDMKDDALPA